MRNVMIAAPSHDGKANVWHTCALVETVKLAIDNDINIIPIYMSFDSLVQRARNDIVSLALRLSVDDLIFIDTDQDWIPDDILKLLGHAVDVVGAPVPKKCDIEAYNVKLTGDYVVLDNGLVSVDSVGTGMLRLTANAMQELWDSSEEYQEPHHDHPSRMIFDVGVVDGELWSEDVVMCSKWRRGGGEVFIDPSINNAHSGEKRWIGDFEPWVEKVLSAKV